MNSKKDDDYSWVNLKDMLGHPEEEQFVGCLYELLEAHIGKTVTDCGSPVMQGVDLMENTTNSRRCNALMTSPTSVVVVVNFTLSVCCVYANCMPLTCQ